MHHVAFVRDAETAFGNRMYPREHIDRFDWLKYCIVFAYRIYELLHVCVQDYPCPYITHWKRMSTCVDYDKTVQMYMLI